MKDVGMVQARYSELVNVKSPFADSPARGMLRKEKTCRIRKRKRNTKNCQFKFKKNKIER